MRTVTTRKFQQVLLLVAAVAGGLATAGTHTPTQTHSLAAPPEASRGDGFIWESVPVSPTSAGPR